MISLKYINTFTHQEKILIIKLFSDNDIILLSNNLNKSNIVKRYISRHMKTLDYQNFYNTIKNKVKGDVNVYKVSDFIYQFYT